MIRTVLFCCLVTAATGCAKNDDVGRAQEDGTFVAKSYLPRIDEIARRNEIVGRADLQPATRTLQGHVKALVDEARSRVSAAPVQLATAAKSGRLEDVTRVTDNLQIKVDHDLTEAMDGVEAIESTVALDETRPKPPKQATAPNPVGSEPSDQPTPPPPP
jgi:hypothetical protein